MFAPVRLQTPPKIICQSLQTLSIRIVLMLLLVQPSKQIQGSKANQVHQSPIDIGENDITVIDRIPDNKRIHKQFNDTLTKFGDSASRKDQCATASDNLDWCSAQIIAFGSSDVRFPLSMSELDSEYCPKIRKILDCVKTSSECYSRFERQIINWILTSTRKMNSKRCKNEAEKSRFVRMTNSCLSQMENPMHKCMHNYVASLDAIAESSDTESGQEDHLVQLSCCANRQFKKCMMKQAKQNCKPDSQSLSKLRRTNSVSSQRMAKKFFERSLKDAMDDFGKTLDGMALSGPEFICNGVTEEFCRNKFDAKFTGRSPRHKSIVPAIIKIYAFRPSKSR